MIVEAGVLLLLALGFASFATAKNESIPMAIDKSKPRGIRNNNAGNIEDNGTAWKGYTGNDGRYVIFSHPEFGIRAMNRVLNTYKNRYSINTIEEIINRWAPPNENNTQSYIASVSKSVGVGPNVELVDEHRLNLIKAIIKHENGQQPYTDETIQRGINLA